MNRLSISSLLMLTVISPARGEPAKKPIMTQKQASAFALLALKGINKEYPNKPGDVLNSEADVKSPRALHPAFFGCFDWHSSVHGHWMLVRLLRLFPDLPEKAADSRRAGGSSHRQKPEGRSRLLHAAESPILRADLRLGLAAEAGGGTPCLGRSRRPAMVEELAAVGRYDRGALPRLSAEADVSDSQRRPSEHGFRTGLRPRLRSDSGPHRECANGWRNAAGPTTATTRAFRRAGNRTAQTSSRRA